MEVHVSSSVPQSLIHFTCFVKHAGGLSHSLEPSGTVLASDTAMINSMRSNPSMTKLFTFSVLHNVPFNLRNQAIVVTTIALQSTCS